VPFVCGGDLNATPDSPSFRLQIDEDVDFATASLYKAKPIYDIVLQEY